MLLLDGSIILVPWSLLILNGLVELWTIIAADFGVRSLIQGIAIVTLLCRSPSGMLCDPSGIVVMPRSLKNKGSKAEHKSHLQVLSLLPSSNNSEIVTTL